MARLFFALWPPAAARGPLERLAADLARRCGGRPVPAAKIHLTLAFLGDVSAEREAHALAAAGSVATPGFTMTFDRVGCFPRSAVAWAGMSHPLAGLEALAAALGSRLRAAGFALEERPFSAHVTLVRRIQGRIDAAPAGPVEWEAGAFALVGSDLRSGGYETRATWNLGTR